MFYTSTRDSSIKITSAQAIAKGISDEGGLFVPCEIPCFSAEKIASMVDMSYIDRAKTVLRENTRINGKRFLVKQVKTSCFG